MIMVKEKMVKNRKKRETRKKKNKEEISLRVVAGDKKITLAEIKRNINILSWVGLLFIVGIGVLFALRFIRMQNYFLAMLFFLLFILISIPAKKIIYNLGVRRARKKHKDFLRDLVLIKLNKKIFFSISGITIISFLILFLIFVFLLIPNIIAIEAQEIILGAHRGSSVDYIENTIEAFEDALNKDKYKFIEFDIQYTKDKKIIVFHDTSLLRMQWKTHNIYDITYKELQNISDYEIPLYSEVMDLIAGKKPLNIEIKSQGNHQDDIEMVDFVVADCKKREILNSTVFSSIDSDVLKYIKDEYPYLETGKIYYVSESSFLNFDVFAEGYYEEMDRIGAKYLMLHASNIKIYEQLKNLKPQDKTLVFWYFSDEMYIINPKQDSWVFMLGKIIRAIKEKEPCIWWCE